MFSTVFPSLTRDDRSRVKRASLTTGWRRSWHTSTYAAIRILIRRLVSRSFIVSVNRKSKNREKKKSNCRPQYWEIYRLKQVVGISLIFMAVDIAGGLFSLLSLIFREDFDIAACVSRRRFSDHVSRPQDNRVGSDTDGRCHIPLSSC